MLSYFHLARHKVLKIYTVYSHCSRSVKSNVSFPLQAELVQTLTDLLWTVVVLEF